jgi:hypothetical protein
VTLKEEFKGFFESRMCFEFCGEVLDVALLGCNLVRLFMTHNLERM